MIQIKHTYGQSFLLVKLTSNEKKKTFFFLIMYYSHLSHKRVILPSHFCHKLQSAIFTHVNASTQLTEYRVNMPRHKVALDRA